MTTKKEGEGEKGEEEREYPRRAGDRGQGDVFFLRKAKKTIITGELKCRNVKDQTPFASQVYSAAQLKRIQALSFSSPQQVWLKGILLLPTNRRTGRERPGPHFLTEAIMGKIHPSRSPLWRPGACTHSLPPFRSLADSVRCYLSPAKCHPVVRRLLIMF